MGLLKVGVIGGGIVGLLSAEEAVRSFPTADITLIADKFDVNTASDGAAGLFMPVLYGFSGLTEEITRKYMTDSYEYYSDLFNNNYGVNEIDGILLSDTTKENCYCKVMSKVLPIYRDATEEELLQYNGKWMYGSYVRSLITKGRSFMPICLEKLKQSRVKVVNKTITNFKEMEGRFDVIINCTGLGAQELCNDEWLIAVRGQVVKARSPGVDKFILAGEDTYIIPYGHGISTLGGTHQFHYRSTAIKPHDTKGIMERCSSLLPQLANTQILWEWAGLRPYRHNVRVEAEKIGNLKVVHNYGHGGSGITTAPGTAKHAVLLMEEMLKTSKL